MGHSDDTAEVFAARASEALRAGNYLLCYDLVDQAQQLGVQTRRLQHLSLLALANAGSTEFAWRRYRELGLREEEIDEDWLALQGRLLKDLALNGGGREEFQASAQAYLNAFRQTGGYFTAINAATMFLLAGDAEVSQSMAREVLALAGGTPPADDTDHYYLLASEAEAALLLGDHAHCKKCLCAADALVRGNVSARSRTRQQLRLICRHLRIEMSSPPCCACRRCSTSTAPPPRSRWSTAPTAPPRRRAAWTPRAATAPASTPRCCSRRTCAPPNISWRAAPA